MNSGGVWWPYSVVQTRKLKHLGGNMKHWQHARRRATWAVTGLALGLVATGAGVHLWLRAPAGGAADQSVAVGAILLGVFTAICAGHEIWRARMR